MTCDMADDYIMVTCKPRAVWAGMQILTRGRTGPKDTHEVHRLKSKCHHHKSQ